MDDLGAPTDLLVVQQDSVISSDPAIDTDIDFGQRTVRSQVRPLVGGLQIGRSNGDGTDKGCTLAFVLTDHGGTPFAVTNTHCGDWGELDGYTWGQNFSISPIGQEVQDYPWNACGHFDSEKCRNSDASLIGLSAGVDYSVRRIANVDGPQGDLNIDSANPDIYIAYEVPESVVNDFVEKIGRTTGRTNGFIRRTCVDMHVWGNDHALPCQDNANYDSEGGDSGAPVFARVTGENVVLYGINFARSPFSDAYFSPMWLVRYDYPNLRYIPW